MRQHSRFLLDACDGCPKRLTKKSASARLRSVHNILPNEDIDDDLIDSVKQEQ